MVDFENIFAGSKLLCPQFFSAPSAIHAPVQGSTQRLKLTNAECKAESASIRNVSAP
jgi:hypothetical protein